MKNKADQTVLLAVSYGTSYQKSREAGIGAVEKAMKDYFSGYELRSAYTSQKIIKKLKERDGLEIDCVEEALKKAASDGIRRLVVQPTHVMDGYEYTNLENLLNDYQDKFEQAVLGKPLLTSDADFKAVAEAVTKRTAKYDDGETAICFIGHGTNAEARQIYRQMQNQLTQSGFENYYIGTTGAGIPQDEIIKKLRENGCYKKVLLHPLMVVAGGHASQDMAGEQEGSWKRILEKEGYEVTCILEGLGQIPAIQDIYISHAQNAADRLY